MKNKFRKIIFLIFVNFFITSHLFCEEINFEANIIELLDKEADKKVIEKIVLINVPSEIYSDLRKVFINLFENSGFNDVKINENVDFEKLYKMKKSQ